jgi:hypothetical protein
MDGLKGLAGMSTGVSQKAIKCCSCCHLQCGSKLIARSPQILNPKQQGDLTTFVYGLFAFCLHRMFDFFFLADGKLGDSSRSVSAQK